MHHLTRLLRPASIAVLGGSQAEEVIHQCQRMGYSGQIWPIHPKKTVIRGLPVYRSVADLPAAPDATFIGVNRELSVEIVRQLAGRGAGGVVCYASGFRETGAMGEQLQAALLAAAGDMPLLGPNCYGFINYADAALLWPDQHGGRPLASGERGVALITQSSNLAINLSMQQRGLPLAYLLTAGNQAQTGLSDLALAVLDDPRVTALGLHIEGFDSVRGMEALARRARELGKPVVALKVGKSAQAQQAAMTHTASLAGAHVNASAFLKRLGVGEVASIEALLETLKLLHVHGPLEGYRLCSMSCSGGEASLMADAAQGRKVYFPALSPVQKAPVEAVLGERVTVDNPLDYHTYIWSDEAGMSLAYQRMLENGFDLSLLVLDFPHPERCDDAAWQVALRAFERAVAASGAPAAVLASLPENLPEVYTRRLLQQGIAALGGMEAALIAAEVAADMGVAWRQPLAEPLAPLAHLTAADPQQVTNLLTLSEAEAKARLRAWHIPLPRCFSEFTHELGVLPDTAYPLVAKKLNIAHKTEANALRLNLQNAQQLQAAVAELQADGSELLIESMITGVVGELIIGVVRDPQLGWVLTLGAGGIFVELLKDTATLLLPASRAAIAQALAGLRIAPLFNGYRGQPAGDLPAAIETILKVQSFVLEQTHRLVELDINPLLVCALGKGVYAADVLMIVEE